MKPMAALAPLALVAACVQVPAGTGLLPPHGTPMIEVYSGGSFSGATRTTIYANDVLATEVSDPGRNPQTRVVQGKAGAYAAALAVIARDGPRVRAALAARPDSRECMDYGSDIVTILPVVEGFGTVGANCPEPELLEFQRKVLDAVSGGN